MDWYRNLKIVLRAEKKAYVLEGPIPEAPAANTGAARRTWEKHVDDSQDVTCLMLAMMIPELQKNLENLGAYEMSEQLKNMFQQQARHERFEVMRSLITCRMQEGTSVSAHVLKMKSFIDQLERLNAPLSNELATDVILNSLPNSYHQFVMNYNMNGWERTIPELHQMLKTAETNIPTKGNPVLAIREGRITKKKQSKGKGKASKQDKGKGKKVATPKAKPHKDAKCFHCDEIGHWKRNCPKYLAELKLKKLQIGESSGIHVIDLFSFSSKSWVFDTGCGFHICNDLQGLKRIRKLKQGDLELHVGNGQKVAVKAVGEFVLELPSGLFITLDNVFYVPSLTKNIISVSALREQGFNYAFDIVNGNISAFLNGVFYFEAKPHNGVYEIDTSNNRSNNIVCSLSSKRVKTSFNQTYRWHCRLGHININRMRKLQTAGILESTGQETYDLCECCLSGKMTKAPFTGTSERAKDLLGLIHTDVCGPFRTMSRNGERYFVTFTDDYSRYGYVYLMKFKHETFEKFKEFQNEVQNQLGKTIKALRSDRGGEYINQEFDEHLKKCGIISQLTPPGTPQLNGVSERRNRTLLDMVRSMMCRTNLPHSFWSYALETATRLVNIAPTKKVEKTPYEMWHGKPPKVSYLRIWGCNAYVTSESSDKLDPRGEKVVFIGYAYPVGYYFYNPAENRVFTKRRGTFLEDELMARGIGDNLVDLEEIREPQINQPIVKSASQQNIVEPEPERIQESDVTLGVRRSTRDRHEPNRYSPDRYVLIIDQEEPSTYKAAISGNESEKWLEAMGVEMQSMYDNQVWDLVELPPECRTVGSKWVFKLKTDMDGNVQTYKARLVAKGFTQTQGVDYEETFSPVAMLKSIRILLAIATYYDYEIWQMDVKTAFLNGHLTEDVYMEQPEGFVDPKNPKKVCKLNKSIYGLKQASRSWNLRFDQKIKQFGFIKNEDEPCVYKKASGSSITFLILYVDDILLIGNNIPMLQDVKSWLGKCFSMKDLGEAAYILGIKIYRDRSKRLLGLSQSAYIDKVIRRFSMQDSKKGLLPMASGTVLNSDQCPKLDKDKEDMKKVPYASAIGSIMYAMLCTRPDVSFALSLTSRYQQNPGKSHWIAVKNILKYLKRTKDMFLIFGGLEEELKVKCYTDASFQTDRDDSRSQTGYVFTLNGGAITWKSSKQSVVAQSTTESEYIAASEAAKEAVWMKKFIADLEVIPSIQKPIEIFCDNTGAIAQAKEPRSHHSTKHILRKFHYIREVLERGDIVVEKIDTDQNLADPFTKPIPQVRHEKHADCIGLRYARQWV
ncbi:putative RNA-directed DNA polymerase [Helianthus annuus]|nr:putative RNA-directed DNA polymerase [Helianthus annuus]